MTSNGKRLGRPPAEESKFSFEYCLLVNELSVGYCLRDEKGVDVKVCQKAFCGVHAFGPKRLWVLRYKIVSADKQSTIIWDKCGKHTEHQQVSDTVRNLIREHIRSFPTRSSHYSCSDNSGRVYLSLELSIARLYGDFLKKHDPEFVRQQEENCEWVISHSQVRKLHKPITTLLLPWYIFVTGFNIYFGYPRSDTCDTCDSIKIKMEDANATPEEIAKLKQELEAHQTHAERIYQAFHYDQQLSQQSWENHDKWCTLKRALCTGGVLLQLCQTFHYSLLLFPFS